MNDRIKLDEINQADFLAEEMGWTQRSHPDGLGPCWEAPDGRYLMFRPNPFTDANDCNDLIKHLVKQGESLSIGFVDGRCSVESIRSGRFGMISWKGDNYMQGVCELALKVLP